MKVARLHAYDYAAKSAANRTYGGYGGGGYKKRACKAGSFSRLIVRLEFVTQTNHTGSGFSFVVVAASTQPAGRHQGSSAFREVVIGTQYNLVVFGSVTLRISQAVAFGFEAVSVREARYYVTKTVSYSSGYFVSFYAIAFIAC